MEVNENKSAYHLFCIRFWKYSVGCYSFQHQVNRSNIEQGFTIPGMFLVIFGQASVAAKPGEGTFDNPTKLLHDKAFLAFGSFNDFQNDAIFG